MNQDTLKNIRLRKKQVEDTPIKGTDLHHMRESNRLLVLNYVREHKIVPRSDLARYTGLSRTTIGNILDELVEEGLVSEGEHDTGDDRRTIPLSFNASAGYVLGCSLGRSHLTILLTDLAATPLERKDIPFATTKGPAVGLQQLIQELQLFVTEQHADWKKIIGVGLAIVGPYDLSLQREAEPDTLAGWAGTTIKQELHEALGVPVYVDNNGNMGALAESRYGAGRNIPDMLYVKVGSGIAGGLILEGRLYRGSSGSAGEIGHMPVDFNGPLCHCGNCGCLEAVAGSRSILMAAQRLVPDMKTTTQVIQAAVDGNPACIHTLERVGNYLGFALACLVNIFNPRLIVLDGSTMQAGEIVLNPLRSTLEAHSLQASLAQTRVVLAERRGIAIALGGVAAVLDAAFSIHAG